VGSYRPALGGSTIAGRLILEGEKNLMAVSAAERADIVQEVLRQTNQVAAPVLVREATGNIECIHCGREVLKGDTAADHMHGCPHPGGTHLYRIIYKDEA
jgi:hypothetical protein